MKLILKISIIFLLIILLLFIGWRFFRPLDNFLKNHKNMIISSSAFSNGQVIPDIYGCHGQDINPPLEIAGFPTSTQSLALLVDDPDAPAGDWVHFLLWNINPQTTNIATNSIPVGAVVGLNDFNTNKYSGPCPPKGTHRYQFKIYALDEFLNLPTSTRKPEFLQAIAGHILDQAMLTGTYNH